MHLIATLHLTKSPGSRVENRVFDNQESWLKAYHRGSGQWSKIVSVVRRHQHSICLQWIMFMASSSLLISKELEPVSLIAEYRSYCTQMTSICIKSPHELCTMITNDEPQWYLPGWRRSLTSILNPARLSSIRILWLWRMGERPILYDCSSHKAIFTNLSFVNTSQLCHIQDHATIFQRSPYRPLKRTNEDGEECFGLSYRRTIWNQNKIVRRDSYQTSLRSAIVVIISTTD